MKMLRELSVAVLLAASVFSGAAAQERPEVREGMRIRISAPMYHQGARVKGTSRWIVGTVREATPTSVVLQTDAADPESRTEIPYDVIRAAEVSQGIMDTKPSVRRGAVRGALVGAGTSAFFYGLMALLPDGGPRDDDEEIINTSPDIVARNTAILMAGGAGIGALIGTQAREKWGPVPVPRVQVDPSRRRASLSFSMDL